MTKRTLTPDNLGSDFELDNTAQKIKVNIDDETIVRDGNGKLKVVVDIPEATPYNITTLPDDSIAPTTSHDTSVAIGVSAGASASSSIAVGNSAQATHVDSTALGSNSRTSKINQVSVAQLNTTTHLADTPRIVSGVASPVVDQDATNKEYVDNLTAVDGTTITRNADGELVASGGGEDSVVYNITELPEGAEAPKANATVIDMDTYEQVEGPDSTGYVVAIGAGAEANGLVVKMPEGGGYGVSSLAIGGSIAQDPGELPQYVPASSVMGGIAIFGQAEGEYTIAIGDSAEATGYMGVAIGYSAGATSSATAIGSNARASNDYSTALGYNARTSKNYQVSIAELDVTTHLAATPRLLSGIKTPEVGQDAANKDYVDNLTTVDGTTITRNAEGELVAYMAENLGDVSTINTTGEETKYLNAKGEWAELIIPKYSLATSQEDGLMSSQDKVRMLTLYDDYIDRFSDLTKAIKLVYSEDVTIPSDSTFEVIYEGIEWVRGVTIPKNTPVFIRNFDGSSEFIDLFQRQYVSEIIYWGSDISRLSLIGGESLSKVPSTIPNALENMSQMFEGCSIFNQDISDWAVGANIVEMSSMFKNCSAFNQDLSSWNATSAWYTDFALGAGFENNPEKHPLWAPPIKFEVWREGLPPKYVAATSAEGSPTIAEGDTFYEVEGLWFYVAPATTDSTQLANLRGIVELYTDLEGDFPTADITDKYGVTRSIPLNQIVMTHVSYVYVDSNNRLMGTLGNSNFNQYIGSWDLSNCTTLRSFLYGCSNFNQPLNLDLPNCTNAHSFMRGCTSFNQPLDINLPSCANAVSFLQECTSFNQPLNLDLPSCTNATYFLYGCTSFNQPLGINLPSCTSASLFLTRCSSFNQPLDINLPNCTQVSSFLSRCTSFNQPLDINLPSCTNAGSFLSDCSSFDQDISNACVPKLRSAPSSWNTGTPTSFRDDTSKHPVWGTCPSN